jgi:hypothetical protein
MGTISEKEVNEYIITRFDFAFKKCKTWEEFKKYFEEKASTNILIYQRKEIKLFLIRL